MLFNLVDLAGTFAFAISGATLVGAALAVLGEYPEWPVM